MYKFLILSVGCLLIGCNSGYVEQQSVNKEPEYRTIMSFTITLPSKPNSIYYQFVEPNSISFDSPFYDLILVATLVQNDMIISTERIKYDENLEWVGNKQKSIKTIPKNETLNSIINEISLIDIDTCIVYNAYSPNNPISFGMLLSVDENGIIHKVDYNGRLCSFGKNEKQRTKLESAEYHVRQFFMDAGAWNGLIVDKPVKTVGSDELKIIDTLYFKHKTMDSRLTKSVNLFYPLDSFPFSTNNVFIANINSIEYYKADLDGDSIVYVNNARKSDRLEQITFKDGDVSGFQDILAKLSGYEREERKALAKDCPSDAEANYIYWNNSALNVIPFTCVTEAQKIWILNKKIKEWFEVKFSAPSAVRNEKR